MPASNSLRAALPVQAEGAPTPQPTARRNRTPWFAAAILFALQFTPLSILALLGSLFALATLLPRDWSALRRASVVYPLFCSIVTLVGHGAYLLGLHFTVWPVTAAALLSGLLFGERPTGKLVSSADLIPCALSLSALCLFVPSLASYHFGLHLPILAFGEDAISHFAIFENILEQRSLIFGRTDILNQILRELANYPQSSHLHAVATYLYLFGGSLNPARLVSFFSAYQMALTAMLVLQLGYLFTDSSTASRASQFLGATVVAVLGAGFVLGYLNLYGFYSQIASYVVLLALSQLLISAEQRPSNLTLFCAAIIESGVAATWFFLSPISYLLLLSWALRNRRSYSNGVLVAAIALNAALNLLYVSLPYINLDPIRYLNFSGAVDALPLSLFVVTGLASAGYFASRSTEEQRPAQFILVTLIGVSAAFAGAIYLYQLLTHGTITYYFHKSLYTLALPLLAASAAAVALLVDATWRGRGQTPESRAGLAVLFAASLVFGLYQVGEPVLHRYIVERPTFLKRDVYGAMLALREVPGIQSRVIFPIGQEPYETHVMTRWLPSLVGSSIWREHYRSPLAYLAGYRAEVARYVSVTKFRRRPVVFDPRGALRAECNRSYFELRKQRRLAILPRSSAAWDTEHCGPL